MQDLGEPQAFRILSLAGGGYLGLYTIRVLVRLEARYGFPLADKFELIAGTSVGGLLALALAAHVPTSTIASIFQESGPEIFRLSLAQRSMRALSWTRGLMRSQFSTRTLRAAIEALVGKDTTLASMKVPVLIPVFDLSQGKPHEFRSAGNRASPELSAVDVALATSAAPTYFPIHTIGDKFFADGGIHANTPDIFAISEALAEYKAPLKNVAMISIGTTYSRRPVSTVKNLNLGKAGWLGKLKIVDLLLEAQNQSSIFLSDRFLGERYIRLNKYLEPSIATTLHLARADAFATTLLNKAAEDTWIRLLANKPKSVRVDNILSRYSPC
jgi:uncharacterized protein